MGFSSKTGISLASGFKYQAKSPLDLRRVVDTVAERNELVTINAAWEGMHVYVKTDKKTYEYRGGTTWTPVLAGSMYTHPTYTAKSSGLYKVTVDGTGHVSATTAVTKSDITALGIPGSDTKYGVFKAATADAAGGTGLVPAPAKGAQGLFLRGDNVWAKPTDTTYNDATTSTHGLMSTADKTKLDGIAAGANKYTHPASHSIDMITETTDKKVMTAAERTKLAGIAAGANKYTHPNYVAKTSGLYKVTVDDTGHISAVAAVTKSDITALGIPGSDTKYGVFKAATADAAGGTGLVPAPAKGAQGLFLRGDNVWAKPTDTTYNDATTSTHGLMSTADKTKLDGIAAGANKYTHPASHSIDMITETTDKKVMTAAERTKLAGIAAGANKYTHPNYVAKTSGLYKVTVDDTGHISAVAAVTKADITGLGIPSSDTWRGIQNNLTSTATDQSLSAAQGKWLNENKATLTTLTNENLDKVITPGFYNAGGGNSVTNKPSGVDNFGMIVVHSASGDYYTQIVYAADKSYRRVCSNGTWGNWSQDILTDTKYVHPTHTAKSSGLYKITVDGTGHVSAATAVTKADITGLGIPGSNTTYNAATTTAAGLMTAADKAKLDGIAAGANKYTYTHPNSGVTAGTYKSVTVDAQGHVTGGSNPTTLAGYGITDAAKSSHSHKASDITDNIPASKISGVLSLDNIPKAALERQVPVADDTARFKLTTGDVQNGDVVKVKSTGLMYFVTDQTKLNSADGYMEFTAGSAASVPWTGVTGKPSTFTPSSHKHAISDITNLQDTLNGKAANKTMTAATASAAGTAGLVPAPAAGKQGQYLRADGTWDKPTDTTYNDVTTSVHGLMTAADKTKLDGIATNANNYTHPTSSGNKHIPSGGSSGKVLRWSADGTAVWGDVPSDAISITRVEYNKLLANNTYDPNKYYYVTDDFDSATIINDSISSTSTAYSSSKTNALLGAKVNKSSKVSATMNASSWSGSSAPYTITLSINGVTTSNNVEILIPGSATNAQVEAWMAAGIVNGTQAANSVTLKAYGDKPSINIPIEAIIRND